MLFRSSGTAAGGEVAADGGLACPGWQRGEAAGGGARARERIQARHRFVALLRRYGIQPYRYRGQRRTTVMARLSRPFVNERPPGGLLGRAAGEGFGEKPDLGDTLDPGSPLGGVSTDALLEGCASRRLSLNNDKNPLPPSGEVCRDSEGGSRCDCQSQDW